MTLWRTRPMFPGLIGLIRLQYDPMIVTFNHGVEGSSPSALTKKSPIYKANSKLQKCGLGFKTT